MHKILVTLDSDAQPSVFDAVVALDAGVDHLLRHGGVKPGDVRPLVYGAMFTRAQEHLRHTAIFIGGADVAAGEALLKAATDAFFGTTRVSVMLDSNGANTTAAAAVVAARRHVPLRGAICTVLAGTGAVGRRAVRMLAGEGARVRVGSRKRTHAEGTCDKVSRAVPAADLTPLLIDTPEAAVAALDGAQIVIACGPPGVTLLPAGALRQAGALQAAIDLNAVPPAGIADIAPADKGELRGQVVCYGALGVGGAKMKLHKAAISRLFTANHLVLDAAEIYALAKEIATPH
ncbi:MAG TPA: NAD(P)-dependent methylenetetrahydromethanopterin dehydrogenase [Lacipirellulaceae bacterium]|nr:NAD(P)-dependent methylenetetrahydromethanopterin dehydrogenase [Lacipirellulaceae bacterium]